MLGKNLPWRNKKYRDWVRGLDCSLGGPCNDKPHHLIGHGMKGTGTTVSDLFIMPLRGDRHTELHNDRVKWEAVYGIQWKFIIRTIHTAIECAVLTREFVLEEIRAQVIDQDDLAMLLEEFEVG